MKNITSKMAGASASHKVRQAEMAGELCSNNASRGAAAASWVAGPAVDYNKPWFERREGDWYCLLCNCWATDTHVWCSKHTTRAENPTWYGFQLDGQPTPQPEYDKPWFEERDGAFYCLLCNSWATEGHLTGTRHLQREACPQYYGFPGYESAPEAQEPQAQAGEALMPVQVPMNGGPEYQKPWFQQRDGDWYCLLCSSWATEGHIGSDRHKRRAEYPDWYGFPSESSGAASHASPGLQASVSQVTAPLPPPWERVWSSDHGRFYFHNTATRVTQWEEPAAVPYSSEAAPTPMPQASVVPGLHSPADAEAEAARPAPAQAAARAPAAAAGATATARALPVPWVEYRDPATQRPYYHNTETKVTQWEVPVITEADPLIEEC